MISRGLQYYDITDVKKHIFKTLDAKRLENAIMDDEIVLLKEHLLAPLVTEKTTKNLSFFSGNLLIQLIPKEAIHLFFQLKEFKRIAEDPLMSTSDIRDKVEELESELMEYDIDIEERSLAVNSYILIYQLQDDGKRQLDSVGTVLPSKILKYFTDERVFICDDGMPVLSDDGIPEGLHYYFDQDDHVTYTYDIDTGQQVGT